MSPALLLLLAMSVRGRIVRMARRLRSPRYLIGFVVGVSWIWLWVGRGLMRGSTRNIQFGAPPEILQELAGPLGEGLQLVFAAVAMLALTLWWLVPLGRHSLEFTEPELNLLLPAPLPRRQIIQYSLLRTQPAILLGTGFMTLMTGGPWAAGGPGRWLALWLFSSIWDLHSRARGLWLARLSELPARTAWRRRIVLWAALLGVWFALMWSAAGLIGTMLSTPVPQGESIAVAREFLDTWMPVVRQSWLAWLLAPMSWLMRPFFLAPDAGVLERGIAWLVPLVALAFHNEWVVRSQGRFEEAAMAHAQRKSRQLDPAARFWKRSQRTRSLLPFNLVPVGRPEVAIVWKNLMLATRLPLRWLAIGILAVAAVLLGTLASGLAPFFMAPLIGFAAAGLTVILPLVAVRGLRYDFRNDLLRLELIRPWPIPGWKVFLAEIAAPICLVALQLLFCMVVAIGVGWLAAAGWLDLLPAARARASETLDLSPALLAPVLALSILPIALVLTALTASIENLAALAFPGWMHLGLRKRQAAAHFGQDLIVFFVLSLAILVGMAPGIVLVGAILLVQLWVWQVPLAGWELPLLGVAGAIPIAAVVAGLVMMGGAMWERLDPSEELLSGGGG